MGKVPNLSLSPSVCGFSSCSSSHRRHLRTRLRLTAVAGSLRTSDAKGGDCATTTVFRQRSVARCHCAPSRQGRRWIGWGRLPAGQLPCHPFPRRITRGPMRTRTVSSSPCGDTRTFPLLRPILPNCRSSLNSHRRRPLTTSSHPSLNHRRTERRRIVITERYVRITRRSAIHPPPPDMGVVVEQ